MAADIASDRIDASERLLWALSALMYEYIPDDKWAFSIRTGSYEK
jgi:hypothetical protein